MRVCRWCSFCCRCSHSRRRGQSSAPTRPTCPQPTGYTHVVEVTGPAKTVYISGQIAFDKDGKRRRRRRHEGAGGAGVQEPAGRARPRPGAKFSDVVKMNTYITDMEQAPAVREVARATSATTTPASTLVQVVKLARPELMIEDRGHRGRCRARGDSSAIALHHGHVFHHGGHRGHGGKTLSSVPPRPPRWRVLVAPRTRTSPRTESAAPTRSRRSGSACS